MEGEMDSNMKAFLAERKININQLAQKAMGDGSETAKERAQRQREFAIAKRVSESVKLLTNLGLNFFLDRGDFDTACRGPLP